MNYYNQKTRITASVIGVLIGITGFMGHGFFEVLHGNTPTNGFSIEAINEIHKFWDHGTQQAVTIIPNFLVTGICAMLISLATIVWSIKYIHVKNGAIIFLSLAMLLTLVGGGIGHAMLFLPTWAYATRTNKSLNWWKNRLSERRRRSLSKLWIYGLVATPVSWLIELELGILGYFPGISDPDTIFNIVFVFLFLSVILANLTFICGFARDIEERN